MAEAMDNPFGEPISAADAIAAVDSLMEPQEAIEPEQEPDVEAQEAETEEESVEVEDPTQESEGPQVLTKEDYGDVLFQVGDEEITLADLSQGYLRQSDYSRKTAELSRQRDEVAEMVNERVAKREAELSEREQLLDQLSTESEPDWVKLADEDPLGWASEKAKWDVKQKVKAEALSKRQADQTQAQRKFVAETASIAQRVFPEWTDISKFDEGASSRRDAALKAGFTEEEYNSTPDYRIAVLLEKAARFDALTSQKSKKMDVAQKKIASAPKVIKPGTSNTDRDPTAERRAAFQKRLSGGKISSDSVRDMLGR
jgi:hypothetical protein